jgi:hypothetical protein
MLTPCARVMVTGCSLCIVRAAFALYSESSFARGQLKNERSKELRAGLRIVRSGYMPR